MTHKAPTDPHDLMLAWDSTWKPHHLPQWVKKRIRLHAIKTGEWVPCTCRHHRPVESFLSYRLFDHWGSVRKDGLRSLVTQPYGNHDEMAATFAEQMECTVKSFTPGPWNEGTFCYVFTPKPEGVSRE